MNEINQARTFLPYIGASTTLLESTEISKAYALVAIAEQLARTNDLLDSVIGRLDQISTDLQNTDYSLSHTITSVLSDIRIELNEK